MVKGSWPAQCTNASCLQTGALLTTLGYHVLFSSSAPSQRLLSEFGHFSLMNGSVLKVQVVLATRSCCVWQIASKCMEKWKARTN